MDSEFYFLHPKETEPSSFISTIRNEFVLKMQLAS